MKSNICRDRSDQAGGFGRDARKVESGSATDDGGRSSNSGMYCIACLAFNNKASMLLGDGLDPGQNAAGGLSGVAEFDGSRLAHSLNSARQAVA
nr:hypothetical protein [uncultured Roseateles sp.]